MLPRSRNWFSVFLMLIAICVATEVQADDRAIELFDGKSLAGWVTEDGRPVTEGWTVEDGMLVRRGRGSIYADKEYGDFDLQFEWKIADRGNSGVKYRVTFYEHGVHGHPSWLGCEYQLFDDVHRNSTPETSTGSIYGLYAPSTHKSLKKVGEFNQSRIVVEGPHIQHWLNGVQVVDAYAGSAEWKERLAKSKFSVVPGFFENAKGRIQLQDHGSVVWFRRITLKDLSPK